MCGIYAVMDLTGQETSFASLLAQMGGVVKHRGPDDHGCYESHGIGLGMRRLSIIDLSGGHQPIANEDESIWLVLNGEIYNYRELREQLEKKGHHFSTK